MDKIRLFEIMQETDKIDLSLIFRWLDNITCKYLCVLHDRDETRAHYHIFVKLDSPRAIDDIAKQCDVQCQYIERGRKWDNMLAYAFHLSDSAKAKEKYKYDKSAVVRSRDINIDDIFSKDSEITLLKQHDEDIKKLLYDYGELKTTKQAVLKTINARDFDKHGKLFDRMRAYRSLQVRDRQLKVVYITGLAGAGKTTLAKYFAKVFNYDIFVSGSGKDVLDGYDKEECIVLDDLRADVFTKAELFKLCDNNTNSAVKSRYNNKDISNCKLLIITSIKAPHELYNWDEDNAETFLQFARRFGMEFLKIQYGNIYSCLYDATAIHYNRYFEDMRINQLPFNMADVFKVLGIVSELKNETMQAIYNAVAKDIESRKKEQEQQLTIDNLFDDNSK